MKLKNMKLEIESMANVELDFTDDDGNQWVTGEAHVTWSVDENNGEVIVPVGCRLDDINPISWSPKDEGAQIISAIFGTPFDANMRNTPIYLVFGKESETIGKAVWVRIAAGCLACVLASCELNNSITQLAPVLRMSCNYTTPV